MNNNLTNAVDLMKAKDNIYTCLNNIVHEIVSHDSTKEAVVEELLDETIKYLSFIQRRLDEISVDRGDTDL